MTEQANPQTVDTGGVIGVDEAVAMLRQTRETADAATPPEQPEAEEVDGEAETDTRAEADPDDGDDGSEESEAEDTEGSEDDDLESEDEADEDADEADDEADDDDEAQSGPDLDAMVKFRAGDEELEVTVGELTKGYLRQRDYTQKSQAIAERRRELDEREQTVEQDQIQYRQKAHAYEQMLRQLDGVVNKEAESWNNVDWAKLKADDPAEFLLKRDEYREWQEQQAAVKSEQQRQKQEAEQERLKEIAKARERLTQQLFSPDYFPHWQDADKAKAEVSLMEKTAAAIGYDPKEMAETLDPRAWKLLWKAAQYDRLSTRKAEIADGDGKAKKPKGTKPKEAVRVMKPNASRPAPVTGPASKRKRAEAKLRKTERFGSPDEAYSLMKEMGIRV